MAVTSLQFAGLTIPPAASLNAVASDRTIAAAGARALVPLTYGVDRVSALILNVLVSGTDANVLLVQCLWGHACDAIDELRLNDQALPAGSVVVSYDGSQTAADPVMVAAFAAQGITYTDTLAGYAFSVVAMPTASFSGQLDLSARVRGRRVYDPRKDSTAGGSGAHRLATPATWQWSDNPSLCLADWLASATYGPGEPVLWSSVPAAANANDATIGSPAEKRRTIGLTLTEAKGMVDLSEALRAYAGCWLVPTSGGMRLIPDADAGSAATYTHDEGQIAELAPLQLRDRGNSPTAVEVVYTDTSQIPYRDASATASLPGAGSSLPWRLSPVRLPGVQRYSQAKREATERLNKLTLADLTTDLEVFDIGVRHDLADIVTITHPVGLSSKPMRITGIEMPAAGRWRLSLTEHDPAVYSDTVQTVASVPDTPRVAPAGPPDDVAWIQVEKLQGAIRWSWSPSTAANYAATRIRLGGSNWETADPLWEGRATGYTQLVDTAGTYTLRAKHVNDQGLESVGAFALSAVMTAEDISPPGSSQAIVYLYQWGAASQPGDPSGQTTYTWGTGAHTAYTGGNGWQTTVPANPGTAGARLWVARKTVVAPNGTVSSSVPWGAGFEIYAETLNGGAGSPGVKAATPTVYKWALSIPSISGSATYTWAAADLGTPPSGWAVDPSAGAAGQTLWAAAVQLVDASGATTSAIDWSTASVTARGYAGQPGISARRAYTLTTASSLGSGTVITTGINTLPPDTTVFGSGLTWLASPQTPSAGQVLYQSDGLYNPSTDQVTWETPYISALKVGNLAALAVNTGALTVNGQLSMGAGGVVVSSNYTAGPSGAGWKLTETAVEVPATGVRGQLTAGQINTNGLAVRDVSGNLILGSGSALDIAYVPGGALNANVTPLQVGSNGVAGSGNLLQNSDFLLHNGIDPTGFAAYGAGSATRGIYPDAALGGSNYWHFFNETGNSIINAFGPAMGGYFGVSGFGGWKQNRNYIVSFYAAASSPLGIGCSITFNNFPTTLIGIQNPQLNATWQRYVFLVNWSGVTVDSGFFFGAGYANWAAAPGVAIAYSCFQVEQGDMPSGWAPIGISAFNPITGGNVSTYISSAAINLAQINTASIGSLSALTATIGLLRSRSSGARTEITDDVIRVYDSSNVLRVKLGDLS